MKKSLGLVVTLISSMFLCGHPATAEAQFGPQPLNQMYYQSTTVARHNPEGLISRFDVQYRRRLFQSNSIFLRDNHIGVGAYTQLSPAFARSGPRIELKPVPMLVLTATYEFVSYFGGFGHLMGYPDANGDYSDTNRDVSEDLEENRSSFGRELTLGVLAQIKVGPLAIRANTRLIHGDYELDAGDRYYYDPIFDSLSENGGWMLTSDIDLLYLHADTWTAGLRYTYTRPYYDDDCGGMACEDNGPFDRVGFVLAYSFFKEYRARFNGPTVLLLAQWHLRNRWRAGQDVNQALPQILVGFDFRGDFLASGD